MQYIQTGENNPELRRVYFHLVDATDGITPEAGEAGGTPTISRNGRTPINTVNTLVAVDASKGDYYLELSLSEIVTPGHLLLHYKSANTAHFAQEIQVMAFDPYTQYGHTGGGGVDIDYRRIQKMIDEAVSKYPQPIEPEKVDLIPISEGLQAVISEIRAIDIPKSEKTNLEPLKSQIEGVRRAIEAIDLPKTDLKPVISRLDEVVGLMEPYLDNTQDKLDALFERIKQYFDGDMEAVKKLIAGLSQKFEEMPYVVIDKQNKKQENKSSVLEEYLKL